MKFESNHKSDNFNNSSLSVSQLVRILIGFDGEYLLILEGIYTAEIS